MAPLLAETAAAQAGNIWSVHFMGLALVFPGFFFETVHES